MRIALILIVIVAAATSPGACKSASQRQLEAQDIIIAPPMEHDPTDRFELARWWSNGTHLLRLDANAAYALFDGQNRFAMPIERGRWSQPSYAILWLEPYNTRQVDPRRVTITKIDGDLALLVPRGGTRSERLAPMFALPGGPPAVIEDRLVGLWEGEFGVLHLTSDLRFALSPAGSEDVAAEPSRWRGLRKGSWRVVSEQLILHSDIPGIDPLRLPLAIEENEIEITSPTGALHKTEARSAPAG